MNILLALLMGLAFANTGIASNTTGNGGYGVRIDGRVFSYDLAVGGSYLNTHAPVSGYALPSYELVLLQRVLKNVANQDTINLVAVKLAEIRSRMAEIDTEFGTELPPVSSIIYHARNFTWIQHPDLPCEDVKDETLPYSRKIRIQLAYRMEKNIRFCRESSELDDANKAALIVHELVYASMDAKGDLVPFIGFVFSAEFKDFDLYASEHFQKLVKSLKYDFLPQLMNKINILQVGSINPQAEADFGIPKDLHSCFGARGLVDGNPVYAIWFVMKGNTCKTGAQYALSTWNLSDIDHNNASEQLQFETGRINTKKLELIDYCSRTFRKICKIISTEDSLPISKDLSGRSFEIINVQRLGTIENPDLFPELFVGGYCFGLITNRSEELSSPARYALWHSESPCREGYDQEAQYLWELGKTTAVSRTSDGISYQVGEIDAPNLILKSLCNGLYRGTCRIHLGGDGGIKITRDGFVKIKPEVLGQIGKTILENSILPHGKTLCFGRTQPKMDSDGHYITNRYKWRYFLWLTDDGIACRQAVKPYSRYVLSWEGFGLSPTISDGYARPPTVAISGEVPVKIELRDDDLNGVHIIQGCAKSGICGFTANEYGELVLRNK